jgi:hypothetical protein
MVRRSVSLRFISLRHEKRPRAKRTQQGPPLILIHPKACARPLLKGPADILQRARNKLVRLIVRNAQRDEVSNVLDIGIVAHPVRPEDVGQAAQARKKGEVWIF